MLQTKANNTVKAFNINFVVNRILKSLGASSNKVEIENLDILQIILSDTLITFSKYFPYQHRHILKPEDKVPGYGSGWYFVNIPLPILGAARIVGGMDNRAVGSSSVSSIGADVIFTGSTMNDLTDLNALNNFIGATSLPITVQFHPPNVVEILPKSTYDHSMVLLNCIHPETLHTIGLNMSDYFIKLATYDVLIALKEILKKFGTISTIFGEISINMEDMDEAQTKKDELIETFRTKSQFRANRKRWYIG
jgi:hypothetical protein